MNLTTATVRPGDSVATFCVRLPRFQGQASSNMKMLGRVVDVTYNSTGVRNIPYQIGLSAEFYVKQFPFFIRTGARQDNAIEKVAKKLENHFEDMSKAYPLLQTLPSITLNQDDDLDIHFLVSLPARTALYSSSNQFFRGLGLGDAPEVRTARRDMSGGSKKLPATKIVTGAFNDMHYPIQFRGDSLIPGTTMNELTLANTIMPETMSVQVEFMGTDRFVIGTPPGEQQEQPATKENAVRLLRIQAERIRQNLNLKSNLIDILPGSGDTVYIGNRAFPGANLVLTLQFNNPMSDAYGWQRGQQLVFPLETARTYDIQVRSQRADPFAGKYPIVMRMAGFGSSSSFIQDHGYSSIMAYQRERGGGDIDLTTVAMIFDSDATYVNMQFIDKQRNVVSFLDGHEISLLMKFQPL